MELIELQNSIFYATEYEQANDPNTDPKVLRSLASHDDPKVRALVTSNPNTPSDVLFELGVAFPERLLNNPIFSLLSLENPYFIADLSLQTQLSLCTLESYYPYLQNALDQISSHHIKGSIAENPDTAITILELMATDGSDFIREQVAKNPNTPPSTLEKLAQDSKDSIKVAVAKNLKTPVAILEKLAQDSEDSIKVAVAENPNTPPSTLKKLERECAVVLALLQCPELPESVLTEIAHSPHFQVRWYLAGYPHCPKPILAQLSEDPNFSVRWVLAAHPDLPESLLQKLANDPESDVRHAAQKRLSTP
ncbi:hypothetical protein [Roseofilum capinflatum]|uniref:Leucine rich repeat variant n=1 Tax=Roseofilum capinflatum BLCC-M114 TaxID=3022440 RepID=A0ABT7B612_9CYAN|nr:hypothetical protein [Roseofilum capinflatum]MDJ1174262.1 hypothetical protein [Roseofilum capinflatum BLCC-M114]